MIWQVKPPYHTNNKPISSSSIDILNPLASKVELENNTCREKGYYVRKRTHVHTRNLPKSCGYNPRD